MTAESLKHTDSAIYQEELKSKQKQFMEYTNNIMKLYPCTQCGKTKYVVTETSVTKICESDCENFLTFNETMKAIGSFLESMAGVLPKEGK